MFDNIKLMDIICLLKINENILIIYKGHAVENITDVSNLIELNYFGYGNNSVKFIEPDIYNPNLFRVIKYLKIYIE